MKIVSHFLIALSICLLTLSCKPSTTTHQQNSRINIITTLFPLYDFASNIASDKANVTLIIPPNVETHSFEPKPEDVLKINKADVFIYTGKYMEPWADKMLKANSNPKLIIVDASKGCKMIKADIDKHMHLKDAVDDHQIDPHIWLDFDNAQVIVENILQGLIKADNKSSEFYKAKADNLKKNLSALDKQFQTSLESCMHREFIHAGHYTFGYLAKKYGLKYIAAFPSILSDAEATAKHIAYLIETIKKKNIQHIFYEELLSKNIANTLSKEVNVELLPLHSAHNLSKDDWDKKVSFISLMQQNILNLQKGLKCSQSR